ncbi:hypothetical protein LXL04_017191 [Taraxacum kok-saghyz]
MFKALGTLIRRGDFGTATFSIASKSSPSFKFLSELKRKTYDQVIKLGDQKKWTCFFCYIFVFLGYILYSDTWSSYYTEGASWDSKNEGLKEEKGPYDSDLHLCIPFQPTPSIKALEGRHVFLLKLIFV